jgi:glycosyltransferase involved in cell wall biosynthesis
MNIHIVTSSYPASAEDPSGTAGLFVRQFALNLASMGHTVVVQPVARKDVYTPDPNITVIPTPWSGGDQELASMNFLHPKNWWIFTIFIVRGIINTFAINRDHRIDRMLCMWAVPSGIFGLAARIRSGIPYDVWVLGSDFWKIRKIPVLGKFLLKRIMLNADKVFADGLQLCAEVTEFTGVPCDFLPSSRILPPPEHAGHLTLNKDLIHFLFVGRYHVNKGPDILVRAIALLPQAMRDSVRVHMFGLGPLEEELRSMIADLQLDKCVELQGPIQAQEFSTYLHHVSFLIIPSRIESIPVVFSDAIQIGTPVVATPVGDLRQLVGEYHCGVVADAVSPEALASALQEAMQGGKSKYLEGTAKAFAQFDINHAIQRWLANSV